MDKDFYQTLGVAREASDEEIKDAYRRLVREHHPDANPARRDEAELLIKEIFLAYGTLADPIKRARYDDGLSPREPAQLSGAYAASEAHSLLALVREAHGWAAPEMAAALGISEATLGQLEARDAIPTTPIQMRTFVNLVETGARKLDYEGRTEAATALRLALSRKKATRAIFR